MTWTFALLAQDSWTNSINFGFTSFELNNSLYSANPNINPIIIGNDIFFITEELYLSKIMQSKLDENYVFVVTQEGHPLMLDRRTGYRMVKKMTGAKGSVRDATTQLVPGFGGDKSQEIVLTCGCDRFLRIYDPNAGFQH